MTLMMLSSEFQYAFSISLYFFTFISLLYSQITKREGREKKTNKKKTLKTHQSTDADTTSTIKKTSRQDESNSIKEGHQL